MPTWLTIVIAVFGLLSTIFGIFGITAYISERAKHRAKKQNDKEDKAEEEALERERKLEEMKHEAYKKELKEIIRSEFAPLAADLIEIKSDLILVKRGVQVTCRNDLEELADKAEHQNFLSAYDKQRFESAYQSYHSLGENGVMDAKRDRILAMPEVKPAQKRKPTTKKKVLLEDK